MGREKLAIDILRESGGEVTMVEEAVRMHMECGCQGGGASCYCPEVGCPYCGFNCFHSATVEDIMDRLAERELELESIWFSGVRR